MPLCLAITIAVFCISSGNKRSVGHAQIRRRRVPALSAFSFLKRQKNSRQTCFSLPGFSLTSVLCDDAAEAAVAEHHKPAVRDPMPAAEAADMHRTVPAEAAGLGMHRLEPVSHRPAEAAGQPCRPRAQLRSGRLRRFPRQARLRHCGNDAAAEVALQTRSRTR